jgi:hypothetical protein
MVYEESEVWRIVFDVTNRYSYVILYILTMRDSLRIPRILIGMRHAFLIL